MTDTDEYGDPIEPIKWYWLLWIIAVSPVVGFLRTFVKPTKCTSKPRTPTDSGI